MRLLRLMPVALAIFLSACSNEYLSLDPDEDIPSGEVVFNLSAKVSAQTKSAVSQEENTINTDDFWIEVFNSQGIRLVSRPYSEIKNTKTSLNAGKDYRFLARHGDSLGAGFNKAFYMADTLFDVRPQNVESVKATARLANVKVAVKFDESIAKYYSDEYYAIVRHGAINKKSIRFEKDETRAGYIPAGELILEVYARLDGEWKYYACAPKVYEPQDFVTFNIETGKTYGSLDVNILVDDEVETVEENVGISAMDLATAPPKIASPKFIDDVYGIPVSTAPLEDNVTISYVAEAGIRSAVLDVEKDNAGYFAGLGLPIDLANLDASGRAALTAAGLFLAGSKVAGVIDFSGALRAMNACPVERTLGAIDTELSLVVTDERGHSDTKTISFRNPEAAAIISIPDYAVWARRVEGVGLSATAGDASLFSLQYRKQGTLQWHTGDFNVTKGLEASTTYEFRTVYDTWYPVPGTVTKTTEAAQQVGNAGFEEWTTLQFNNAASGKANNVNWYVPYSSASNAWWAVNSMKTMLSFKRIMGLGPEQYTMWKTCPTVMIDSSPYSGSKAATLNSTGVGTTSNALGFAGTRAIARGELFIGTADDSGNHTSEGHAFSSRPSALNLYHKFEAYNNEPYEIEIDIYSNSGKIIGKGYVSSEEGVDDWKELNVPLVYTDKTQKAAKIYILFASSTSTSPETRNPREVDDGTPCKGTSLHIDNINLIYE